jgi:hypothetical protein
MRRKRYERSHGTPVFPIQPEGYDTQAPDAKDAKDAKPTRAAQK